MNDESLALELMFLAHKQLNYSEKALKETIARLEELLATHPDNDYIFGCVKGTFLCETDDAEVAIERLVALLGSYRNEHIIESITGGLAHLSPQSSNVIILIRIAKLLESLSMKYSDNDSINADYAESLFWLAEEQTAQSLISESEQTISKLTTLAKQHPENEVVVGFASSFN